jgi:hypothetical protein
VLWRSRGTKTWRTIPRKTGLDGRKPPVEKAARDAGTDVGGDANFDRDVEVALDIE